MKVQRAQIDAGGRILRIEVENLFVERDGARLFAGLLGLYGGQEALLDCRRVRRPDCRSGAVD